jgi:hypothetical protein
MRLGSFKAAGLLLADNTQSYYYANLMMGATPGFFAFL